MSKTLFRLIAPFVSSTLAFDMARAGGFLMYFQVPGFPVSNGNPVPTVQSPARLTGRIPVSTTRFSCSTQSKSPWMITLILSARRRLRRKLKILIRDGCASNRWRLLGNSAGEVTGARSVQKAESRWVYGMDDWPIQFSHE